MEKVINFSWVEESVIAGSSFPFHNSHMRFFEENNIEIIINLTNGKSYNTDADLQAKFKVYNIKIEDFHPASLEQILEFWQITKKHNNHSIVVHCIAGCGRTGTMLAAWLLLSKKVKTAQEAINKIREMRPCSIETREQELSIINLENYLKSNKIN